MKFKFYQPKWPGFTKISSPITLVFDLVFYIYFAVFYLFLKFWNNEQYFRWVLNSDRPDSTGFHWISENLAVFCNPVCKTTSLPDCKKEPDLWPVDEEQEPIELLEEGPCLALEGGHEHLCSPSPLPAFQDFSSRTCSPNPQSRILTDAAETAASRITCSWGCASPSSYGDSAPSAVTRISTRGITS
jgi:hypothetical protein